MNSKKRNAFIAMLKKLEFIYIRLSDLQTKSIYDGNLGESKCGLKKNDVLNGIRIDVKSLIDDIIDML